MLPPDKKNLTFDIMQDIIVGDHYRLGARIAVGGFGLVYSGAPFQFRRRV